MGAKIALFDPKGQTTVFLETMGVQCQPVGDNTDLSSYDILVVGKAALKIDRPAPDIGRVQDGFKVICSSRLPRFWKSDSDSALLNTACGKFSRVCRIIRRLPVLMRGQLRDWRGEATILPPRLKYEMLPRYGPTVQWC